MADGLNISNLPANVQEFIKQHNIDVDGDNKVSSTELANMLAQVSNKVECIGDTFNSSDIQKLLKNIPQEVITLLDTIVKIDSERAEDRVQFDKQEVLIKQFLNDLDVKGEISEQRVDELTYSLQKSKDGYKEKVGNRYSALDDALNNVGAAYTDPQHPTGLKDPTLILKSRQTQEMIEAFVKEQTIILNVINNNIHEGVGIDQMIDTCTQLLMATTKFSVEMQNAMAELESYGIEALKDVTANMPGRNVPEEMKSIANLASTVGKISEEIKADQAQFKKFISMIQDQIEKIHDLKNINEAEMAKQFEMMHETLSSEVEQFAGRYDRVLADFANFDLDTIEPLKEKSDEVAKDKEYATERYKNQSDELTSLTYMLKHIVSNGESKDNIKNCAMKILDALENTSYGNNEAMRKLESDALDFIKEAIWLYKEGAPEPTIEDNNTAVNVPASEQKANNYYDLSGRIVASPREGQLYIHNGRKIVYGQE